MSFCSAIHLPYTRDSSRQEDNEFTGDLNSGLSRLLREQKSALESTVSKITTVENYIEDYERVLFKLSEQIKHFSQRKLIPFGPKCYVWGKIVHTNEVRVHLGADYYADVSVFQANKLLHRRIKNLNSTLDELKQQRKLLLDRESYVTTQLSGKTPFADSSEEKEADIVEEFDPIREAEWREKHKLSLKREKEITVSTGPDIDINALRSPDELSLKSGSEEEEEPDYFRIYFKHDAAKGSSFKYPLSSQTMTPSQAINYFNKHKHLTFNTVQPTPADQQPYELPKPIEKNQIQKPFEASIVERNYSAKIIENKQISTARVSRFKADRLKRDL
ncbi:uri1, prefoldin-like chaperone [Cichlidogyrus casuarinus]|uniref:Uri1, prefoldin-like chaperone n=1 Tax=Cichlidogyrus casuarinus TaxID=1844966 RepID=A0ABD2QDM5_9PLAT